MFPRFEIGAPHIVNVDMSLISFWGRGGSTAHGRVSIQKSKWPVAPPAPYFAIIPHLPICKTGKRAEYSEIRLSGLAAFMDNLDKLDDFWGVAKMTQRHAIGFMAFSGLKQTNSFLDLNFKL